MKRLTRSIVRLALRGLGRALLAPIETGVEVGRYFAARPLLGDRIVCDCGADVEILGAWECPCGFAFYGWYWDRCRHCSEVAGWIDCPSCHASIKNPLL